MRPIRYFKFGSDDKSAIRGVKRAYKRKRADRSRILPLLSFLIQGVFPNGESIEIRDGKVINLLADSLDGHK
jgi:hypothetical protein